MGAREVILKYLVVTSVITLFCCGFFWRCANVSGTPQGGPKDTLPPNIVKTSPALLSSNVHPKRILIEFDEYVQLKDLQKEFFTSPFMRIKPNVTLRGRGIAVDMKSELDSNTTYVLNFGQSVVDNNEANPYIGLKYIFSTGNDIDSIFMSGYVEDAKTTDTVANSYLFFYDVKADSVPEKDSVIFKSKALAVTRTTPNGIFIHSNLKPIDYRIYAMVDNNANQTYEPGVDDIAFMDTVYNPSKMPSFNMWYDSTRMYYVAEPQMFMRTFREEQSRRQNLSSFTRPEAQKLILKFSAKNPVIKKFVLKGIDSTKIVVEQTKITNDSTIYWLNIPKENLPDTIVGEIIYERHDSAGILYPYTQELKFAYKKPFVSGKEQREADKKAKEAAAEVKTIEKAKKKRKKKGLPEPVVVVDSLDSDSIVIEKITETDIEKEDKEPIDTTVKKSKFKYTMDMDNPMTPTSDIKLNFEFLVTDFNTKSIVMTHTDIKEKTTNIPFTITQDSLKVREYSIRANFKDAEQYSIMIPAGAITTIDAEVNDTITKEITIGDIAKYASFVINLSGANPKYEYVVQIMEADGKKAYREIAHLGDGKHKFDYIPTGKVALRILEDRNHNGKWDTGDLIKRIQPEKVITFVSPTTGHKEIATKANWEVEFEINLTEMFKERVHISSPDRHNHEGDDDHDNDNQSTDDKSKETNESK